MSPPDKREAPPLRKAIGIGVTSLFLSVGTAASADAAPQPETSPAAASGERYSLPNEMVEAQRKADRAREERQKASQEQAAKESAFLSRFTDQAKTDYSRQLEGLSKEYQPLVPEKKIDIIDPDTANTYPYNPIQYIKTASKLTPEGASEFAENIKTDFLYLGGNVPPAPITATAPFTLPDKETCTVLPVSYGAPNSAISISGMNAMEITSFVNRHEFRHCTDSKFFAQTGDSQTETVSLEMKREAYADMMSLGDMIIKEGKSADVIDRIDGWRKSRPYDPIHYTTPALAALKDEIQKMGIDKFRAMPEENRNALCQKLVDENMPTPQQLDITVRLSEGKSPRWGDSREDVKYVEKWLLTPAQPGYGSTADTHLKEDSLQQLNKWDASAALKKRATELSGKVTPESMTQAHTHMTNEFRREWNKDLNNTFYPAMEAKLHETFKQDVKKLIESSARSPVTATTTGKKPSSPKL